MTKQSQSHPTELEQARQITRELREATRAARETHKDLRASMKEFEDLITRRADELLKNRCEVLFEGLMKDLNCTIDSAQRAALLRFEEHAKTLLTALEGASSVGEMITALVRDHMEQSATTALSLQHNAEIRARINGKLTTSRFPDSASTETWAAAARRRMIERARRGDDLAPANPLLRRQSRD